jgi:flagellar biosynthesis/type III secretory pathway protein FliH
MLLQQQETPEEWQHFDWVEDKNLQPGSVRIRTEHAAVEDLFQNRIAGLMQELLSQSEGDSHV